MGVCGLLEVEPFVGDAPETLGTRSCDLCGESGPNDTFRGQPWRTFYYDPAEALSVCEFCVEAYLQEKP